VFSLKFENMQVYFHYLSLCFQGCFWENQGHGPEEPERQGKIFWLRQLSGHLFVRFLAWKNQGKRKIFTIIFLLYSVLDKTI